jgi:hypothetical protein
MAGRPIAGGWCAYVVGWPISITADLPANFLLRASWARGAFPGSFVTGKSELVLNSTRIPQDSPGRRRREDLLCVNPISARNGVGAQKCGTRADH